MNPGSLDYISVMLNSLEEVCITILKDQSCFESDALFLPETYLLLSYIVDGLWINILPHSIKLLSGFVPRRQMGILQYNQIQKIQEQVHNFFLIRLAAGIMQGTIPC